MAEDKNTPIAINHYNILKRKLLLLLTEMQAMLERKLIEALSLEGIVSTSEFLELLRAIELLEARMEQIRRLLAFLEQLREEGRLDEIFELIENLNLGDLPLVPERDGSKGEKTYVSNLALLTICVAVVMLSLTCFTFPTIYQSLTTCLPDIVNVINSFDGSCLPNFPDNILPGGCLPSFPIQITCGECLPGFPEDNTFFGNAINV